MISETLALAREVPALFVGFVILLGLIIGNFLNVVIHRLPKMMACEWRLFCAELDEKPAPNAEPFNLFTSHSRCSGLRPCGSCDREHSPLKLCLLAR